MEGSATHGPPEGSIGKSRRPTETAGGALRDPARGLDVARQGMGRGGDIALAMTRLLADRALRVVDRRALANGGRAGRVFGNRAAEENKGADGVLLCRRQGGSGIPHRAFDAEGGEAQPDPRSLTQLALDLEPAAMQLDQGFHQRQAEARALIAAV